MLLQLDLNKCRLSQLAKLDKLYINSSSSRFLQIYKNGFIYYNNQIFTNNLHVHLRAGGAASSYTCTPPITG